MRVLAAAPSLWMSAMPIFAFLSMRLSLFPLPMATVLAGPIFSIKICFSRLWSLLCRICIEIGINSQKFWQHYNFFYNSRDWVSIDCQCPIVIQDKVFYFYVRFAWYGDMQHVFPLYIFRPTISQDSIHWSRTGTELSSENLFILSKISFEFPLDSQDIFKPASSAKAPVAG